MMDVDMEGASNGKDMESDESDNEAELEVLVNTLENQIAENVFSYQSHVDLINVLKRLADLDRLRTARNRMAKQFPLTSDLWLSWLEDEIKIASTIDEKKNVLDIFERAVKDYLCIEIWLKYLEFVKDLYRYESDENVAQVRKVCECSLTAGGLHVTKGSLLWKSYIDYEIGQLQLVKNNPHSCLNQLKVIANLYKRFLSCALIDIDENFNAFCSWLHQEAKDSKDVIEKNMVENIYKKSKEKLQKIKVYEDALVSDIENTTEHYKEYIEHEKSKAGSPVRVQILYERMVCDFCLNEEIWEDYINFVSTVLKNGTVVIEVIQRSLRNCPWSFHLHRFHILSLEKYKFGHETIRAAFEQAVASGLQKAEDFRDIWMTYLEYLRRRFDDPDIDKEEENKRFEELRANFAKAAEFLSELNDSDPEFVVLQFWARIEAIFGKNMEKCRALWNDILSDYKCKTSEMWLEYINIESMLEVSLRERHFPLDKLKSVDLFRAFGDSKHLRKLYLRALQNTHDSPEKIAKSWLNFERDEGTLESYETCVEKIKMKLNQVKEKREKEEAQKRAEEEKAKENFQIKKSKRTALGWKKQNLGLENNSHGDSVKKSEGNKKRTAQEIETTDVSPKKKSRKEENEELVEKLLEEANRGHGVTVVHDSSKDDRTVFVSNLDFTTEEQIIRDTFTICGEITDLRLVKDYKGRSKGYCYVEFEKPAEAASALKKDRELINGRPMFVSKCDPDKETRGKVFKYSSTLEKNKLFVRGLPYSTTENDLRELFSKYGTLKDVRLVTYRNGHSKGLAYVDYEDEVSAAQAIIKTDGITVGDRQISVALSNPPDRKVDGTAKLIDSLGGGVKELGPRGRGRTQISFVPRAVKLNSQGNTTPSLADLSISTPKPSQESKKLSNADFRAMIN